MFVAVLLLVAAVAAQFPLKSARNDASPALAEGAYAAVGGLRSIVAEVIWFRADRLQEEGRFIELAQLAGALVLMEPHTPEVWSYAAWNLAYNVSVMMQKPEDRWRWVESAIRLLRDQGLMLNPRESEIYRELAWLFELKLAADIDTAAPYYRKKWAETVADVKKRGAWSELGMDPMRMLAIERYFGDVDWTNSCFHAIYWAMCGLEHAQGVNRRPLEEIIRQSTFIYNRGAGGKSGAESGK